METAPPIIQNPSNPKEKILFSSSFSWWFLSILGIIFLGSFCFFFDGVYRIVYIIAIIIIVFAMVPRKFVFYDDRIEIIKLNSFSPKQIFKYNELLKIEYRQKYDRRSGPEIIIVSKDKPNNYRKDFWAPSDNKTRELLKEMHDRGVKIEFNCDRSTNNIKSW